MVVPGSIQQCRQSQQCEDMKLVDIFGRKKSNIWKIKLIHLKQTVRMRISGTLFLSLHHEF